MLGKDGPWSASDIAFQLATRINARGRVDDAMRSVEFLVAEDGLVELRAFAPAAPTCPVPGNA